MSWDQGVCCYSLVASDPAENGAGSSSVDYRDYESVGHSCACCDDLENGQEIPAVPYQVGHADWAVVV